MNILLYYPTSELELIHLYETTVEHFNILSHSYKLVNIHTQWQKC